MSLWHPCCGFVFYSLYPNCSPSTSPPRDHTVLILFFFLLLSFSSHLLRSFLSLLLPWKWLLLLLLFCKIPCSFHKYFLFFFYKFLKSLSKYQSLDIFPLITWTSSTIVFSFHQNTFNEKYCLVSKLFLVRFNSCFWEDSILIPFSSMFMWLLTDYFHPMTANLSQAHSFFCPK